MKPTIANSNHVILSGREWIFTVILFLIIGFVLYFGCQDIGIIQFIEKGKPQDVERRQGDPVFQGIERDIRRPELPLEIRPGSEDALGQDRRPAVENRIEDRGGRGTT